MIKHFNTALGTASGSSSTTSSKKGGGALIWVVALGIFVYVGYKFIENRNRIKQPEQN
jgi:hypothetical protein